MHKSLTLSPPNDGKDNKEMCEAIVCDDVQTRNPNLKCKFSYMDLPSTHFHLKLLLFPLGFVNKLFEGQFFSFFCLALLSPDLIGMYSHSKGG